MTQSANEICIVEDLDYAALHSLTKQAPWILEFLRLLCALDPAAINEAILLHATELQQRWSASGDILTISFAEMVPGIKVLDTKGILEQTLGTLLESGFITSEPGEPLVDEFSQ